MGKRTALKISEETAKGAATELATVPETSKYARLTETDMGLILRLKAANYEQKQIAGLIGCSQSTVSDFLHRVGDPATVVQKVLKARELEAAAEWSTAVKVAAKRGDHRPARELIEMANPELRPQPSNSSGGVGVQIVIGMPGQPVQLPTIEASFRPAQDLVQGETAHEHSGITSASHNGDSVNHD